MKEIKKEIVHRFHKEIKEKDCPQMTLIYTDYFLMKEIKKRDCPQIPLRD